MISKEREARQKACPGSAMKLIHGCGLEMPNKPSLHRIMDLSTGAVFSHALCMDLSTGAVFSHDDGPDYRRIVDEMCINTCV